MTSQLTEIRSAAVALLKKRFLRVYDNRVTAPAHSQLPCVVVYIDGRRSEVFNVSPVELKHTVRLVTMVCVQANEQADALAEEMLAVVERLFYANPTLRRLDVNGEQCDMLADDLLPDNLNIEYDDSGEYVCAYYQQGWQAVYHEQCGEYVGGAAEYYPQAVIVQSFSDGLTASNRWQLYGTDPEIEAEDLIPKG